MARYDTDGSSALAPNDPYNKMEGAITRPNFQVIDGGKTTKSNNSSNRNNLKAINGGKSNSSKDLLRDSENSAISKKNHETGSAWANNVTGRNLKAAVAGGAVKKKKSGIYAFAIIIMLLCGGGAFLSSSHSLLMPAMESLMTEATDWQHASFIERTANLVKFSQSHHEPSKTYAVLPANTQAKTQQGRVATFFDSSADATYKKFGLDRNIFYEYKQTGNTEADMEQFRNTMSPKYDNNSSTLYDAYKEEIETTGEDGKTNTEIRDRNTLDLDGKSNVDIETAEGQATTYLKNISSSAEKANKAANGANMACMAMRVGATISSIVAANELYQSIYYFMNYMESGSKMKYGEGSNSPINEVLNNLTAVVEALFPNLYLASGSSTITGAPVQANGMQMMLANAPADSNTTRNYSIERTSVAVAGALGMSSAAVKTCAGVQAGAAVVSIVTTISTLGVSAIGQVLLDVAIGVGTSVAISAALAFIVPTIAKSLFTNIFETTTGIPAGELLARGASAANTRIGRTGSGQSLASSDVVLAYNRINQEVIAREAEADRANRSPFDLTSKNTFLGSIAYSFLPITLLSPKTTTSLMTNINTLTRTTSSAIASISGTASALTNHSYMTNFGDKNECQNLTSIGAVGDIYCNPVTVTDPTTINIDPNNVDYVKAIENEVENCDDNGYCEIKKDGELAKYINYCANRDSPFGIVDASIVSALEYGNNFIGAIPIIGSIVDIVNSGVIDDILAWATGERCGNTPQNSKFWNKLGKYFQRYVEDQRIFAWAGAYGDKSSPAVAYMKKYEEEHPLDNSPAGYLARISGVAKEDVELALAVIDYYNFVEDYDPTSRIAMLEEETSIQSSDTVLAEIKASTLRFEEQDTNPTIIANTQYYIVYDDLRNRSHVA